MYPQRVVGRKADGSDILPVAIKRSVNQKIYGIIKVNKLLCCNLITTNLNRSPVDRL